MGVVARRLPIRRQAPWWGLLVLCGLLAAPAGADWRPGLQAAEAGLRSPLGALRVRLPPGLPGEVRQRLLLELDGLDVTALLAVEGDTLVFTPAQPLAWGEHELRLVEETTEGELLERGAWRFEVRRSRQLREAQARLDAELLLSARLAQASPEGAPDPFQAQGSARLAGMAADGDWRAGGSADLYLVGDTRQAPTGRSLDLGEYQVDVSRGVGRLRLGHQDVGADNLVLREFDRRGVSAALEAPSGLARVTGFAQRSESVIGIEDPSGLGDADNRTGGALLTLYPFAGAPERLFLSATLLSGRGSESGYADVGDTVTGETAAWSAVADARLLDRRLRLRGEYAATRADFDLADPASGRETDQAYALLADFTPAGAPLVAGEPLNWGLGLEQRRVGTFFRSLGNAGLPTDKFLRRAFARLDWGGLSLNASFGAERDNVGDLAFLPVTGTERGLLAATWSPAWEGGGLFAQPGFSASLVRTRQKTRRLPSEYGGQVADTLASELQLGAAFYPGSWDWSVGYILSWFDDRTGQFSDTRNGLTTLELNLPLGEWLHLSPVLQWNRLDERDTGTRSDGLLLELGAGFTLLPERLDGSLNVSLNRERASDDTVDTRELVLDASLNWTLRPARSRRPGLVLFLSGNFQDLADPVSDWSWRDYQLFAGVRSTLPLAYD